MQRTNKVIRIDHLPLEILIYIFSYIYLVEASANLPLVSKRFKSAVDNGQFWKEKFNHYFPEVYNKIQHPDRITIWYKKFFDTYQLKFKGLSPLEIQIFIATYDRDLKTLEKLLEILMSSLIIHSSTLENILNRKILANILDIKDSNGKTLEKLLSELNNQDLFDFFYRIELRKFTVNNNLEIKKCAGRKTILYWAIALHQPYDEVARLLKLGSSLDEIYCNDQRPIHLATSIRDLSFTQLLIDNHANENNFAQLDCKLRTPIELAIQLNKSDYIIYYIINKKIKLALIAATRMDLYELVKSLLDANPNLIEEADEFNQTALTWAAINGHTNIMALLIERNAKLEVAVNNPCNALHHEKTPLYFASEKGHDDCVKLLLTAGADANKKFTSLPPYMNIAAENGHLTVVQLLYNHNPSSIEQEDKHGFTPVLTAITHGRRKVAMYLIENYARFSILAAAAFGLFDIVKKRIDENISRLEQQDPLKQTALFLAARFGHAQIVDYLIDKKANVNVISQTPGSNLINGSALYCASENGHDDIVRLLLRAGADANIKTSNNLESPIHIAANNDHVSVVKILLTHDHQLIDTVDKNSNTALIIATQNNNYDMIDLLTIERANLNVINNSGSTALLLSVVLGYTNITEKLLDSGADNDSAVPKNRQPFIHWLIMQASDVNRQNTPDHNKYERALRVFAKHYPYSINQDTLKLAIHLFLPQIIMILIECNPGLLKEKGDNGNTALCTVIEQLNRDNTKIQTSMLFNILTYLIANNASVNAANRKIVSPLLSATNTHQLDVIKILLNAGADPTVGTGSNQAKPIDVAIKKGQLDTLKLYIEYRPDLLDTYYDEMISLANAIVTKTNTNLYDEVDSRTGSIQRIKIRYDIITYLTKMKKQQPERSLIYKAFGITPSLLFQTVKTISNDNNNIPRELLTLF